MANRNEKGTTLLRGTHTATLSFSPFDSGQRFKRGADDSTSFHHDARAGMAAGVRVSSGSFSMPAASGRGEVARHGMASVAAPDDQRLSLRQAGHRGRSDGAQATGRHACTGLYLYLAI